MEEELEISKETYEKVRKIYQDFINDNDDADWTLDDYLDEEEEYEENYYKKEDSYEEDEKEDNFNVSQEAIDRFIKCLEEEDEEDDDDFEIPKERLGMILARKSLEHRRRKKDKILSSLTREECVCFFMLEAERGNELAEKYGMRTYDIEEDK